MRLNIDIDENHEETSVTIQAKEWSEELEEIAAVIKKRKQRRLFGMDEEQTVLLNPPDIDYIYAQKRKVFAVIKDRELEIRMKLYEIEEILIPYQFMRFSKSVIGNLGRIERFELSFNGNLCVYFQSGSKEYITRKYVKPIKDQLMKGGQ
ncbi:LytTR family DNA-binding domain-containing protein [Oceanobacillus jordanicus]|uniref:LytTR family transcriptional regulator n=1 Tax=Oceanobacillus jordanicus TaxID=2867266 RepID=A0AAW5B695_9BACI|nr:LytTR family DNA-binding domain-containing protein [Oceanobacillus jordanicus]MCG3419235.1 LytTR family transcriptional regulator [Oceanobacillus jordanicus]